MASSVILTLWWASYLSRKPRNISIVCITVGSEMNTGWKRRSSAASFSMCFWYSFRVVAPIRCILPRARWGLIICATSRPPSSPVPPAFIIYAVHL